MVDAWSKCTDKVAGEMMKGISATQNLRGIENNPFMMADSGARPCSSDEAVGWYESLIG